MISLALRVGDTRLELNNTEKTDDMTDIEQITKERDIMKSILSLIASGAIYGDNCRAIANTTLNELYLHNTENNLW